MIRRPPRSTQSRSSAASDVYKRQIVYNAQEAARLNCYHSCDTASKGRHPDDAICIAHDGTPSPEHSVYFCVHIQVLQLVLMPPKRRHAVTRPRVAYHQRQPQCVEVEPCFLRPDVPEI